MLELKIIEHCAPTLAGLKSANLFDYEFLSLESLNQELQQVNMELNAKGVNVEILRLNPVRSKALLYVYRKKKLEESMQRPGVEDFLRECGCEHCDETYCVQYLKNKFRESEKFPHEIGLFLGYPLEDVQGFIKFKGKNCKCCGIWKVYCNECETKKLFVKLKKCTAIYVKKFASGRSLSQLTIAA